MIQNASMVEVIVLIFGTIFVPSTYHFLYRVVKKVVWTLSYLHSFV